MNFPLISELLHYCNVALTHTQPISEKPISYYDLSFMLNGELTYRVDGKTYLLRKNDIIFIRPGQVRQRLESHENVRFVSFNFLIPPNVTLPFSTYMENAVTPHIRTALDAYPESHRTLLYHSEEKCMALLHFILYELWDPSVLRTSNPHVRTMLAYLEQHKSEKISLTELSRSVHLSKEYCATLFRKEMGETIIDYINRNKMELAKSMIISGEMSLHEIAAQLGFDHYHYFSKLFKKQFGITPIQSKKEN